MPNLLQNRVITDVIWLAGLAVAIWLVSLRLETFEALYALSRDHENWEVDEIAVGIATVGFAGFVYAVRRGIDLRAEIIRRDKAEADVSWLADHDMLTKLPNRHFLRRVIAGLDRRRDDASGERVRHVVYAVDLDGFKQVNDLLGHEGGDKLLVELSERMQQVVGDDQVFRVGGDEFVVLASENGVEPESIARELVNRLSEPLQINGARVQVGASVGIARHPEDSALVADVIRRADVAMYAAKKRGRGGVKTFDQAMEEELKRRIEVEAALRQALETDDIVPYYQPVVDIGTGKVTGFEALARWTRPTGEEVSPATFIRHAENIGLIVELSDRLLARACRDATGWPGDKTLSFNISPVQLTDDALGLRILRVLAETGLPPHRLDVEITETALVTHYDVAVRIIDDLRAAGVRISLDDFGTGYSSLSQLSRLNFDKLKIDRSFVSAFEHDEKTRKIVRSMVALGHGLGIRTTAEGVESQAQLDWLRELGCEDAQGFLFSEPVPPEEVARILARADGAEGAPGRRGTSSVA